MKHMFGKINREYLIFCLLAFICVGCTNASSRFEHLRNAHIIYEGVIDSYSVGPFFNPQRDIIMEIWFAEPEFIYGYWKEKDSDYKHYLKGEFTSLKKMYGTDAGKKRKEEKLEYGYPAGSNGMIKFEEMSSKNAKYRIRFTEYRDEHFSQYTDNAFYVYNFEDNKLQGNYYSWKATSVGNNKGTWSTAFSTLFSVKKIK